MLLRALSILLLALLTWAAPLQAEELVIGTDASFMPFEYKENGQFVGFDIDLWDAVARELGVTYRFRAMDFNGLIPALQSGGIDAAIAGITITPERDQVIDFSQPYYKAGLRIMVRADRQDIQSVEDLKDQTVASKLGTTSADFLRGKVGQRRLFPQTEQSYLELMIGGVDAVVYDSPALEYYANTAGKGRVKLVGPLYQGQNYGIAFPEGSPLRNRADQALSRLIDSGHYALLYQKWFGKNPPEFP